MELEKLMALKEGPPSAHTDFTEALKDLKHTVELTQHGDISLRGDVFRKMTPGQIFSVKMHDWEVAYQIVKKPLHAVRRVFIRTKWDQIMKDDGCPDAGPEGESYLEAIREVFFSESDEAVVFCTVTKSGFAVFEQDTIDLEGIFLAAGYVDRSERN
jgi:hypothetical protein